MCIYIYIYIYIYIKKLAQNFHFGEPNIYFSIYQKNYLIRISILKNRQKNKPFD